MRLRRLWPGKITHPGLRAGCGLGTGLCGQRHQPRSTGSAAAPVSPDLSRLAAQWLTLPPQDSVTPASFIDTWRAWARTQPRTAVDPAMSLRRCSPRHAPSLSGYPGGAGSADRSNSRPARAPPGAVPRFPPGRISLESAACLARRTGPRSASAGCLKISPGVILPPGLAGPFRRRTLCADGSGSACSFLPHGLRGWVLLFDEGEAMLQGARPMRARGYRTLHRLVFPATPSPDFHPVFAFTPDFFQRLHEEDYSLPPFERNYADALRSLGVYHLRGLSRAAWHALCATLSRSMLRHTAGQPTRRHCCPVLTTRLQTLPLQDPRTTLKGLVDELDQAQQQTFFAQQVGERSNGSEVRILFSRERHNSL